MGQRHGLGAFLAVAAAFVWALGFAIWAYVGAAGTECITRFSGESSCRSTPLAHGFGRELVAVMAPALICLATWALLRRYCTRGTPLARGAAAVLASLSAVLCLLAAASITLLLMPIGWLLLLAVLMTDPPPPATPPPRCTAA